MADYRIMYTTLYNKITDAITLLQTAQTETEDIYINQADPKIIMLGSPDSEK